MPRVRQRGTITAEFAMIIPLVVTVVFGTIEAGRMVVSRAMLSNAAIEGANVAAAMGTANEAAVLAAVTAAAPMLPLTSITVVMQPPGPYAGRAPGNIVTVTVIYDFQPMIGVVPARTWTEVSSAVVQ